MHVRDWKLFLDGDWAQEIAIAQLSREMTDYLEAASPFVHLHQDYARKAVDKHQLTPAHFPLIFETVDYGMALADRPRHISFLHFDATTFQKWFQVSVKRGFEDRRIFVTTFHRSEESEVARKSKRYEVIRPFR